MYSPRKQKENESRTIQPVEKTQAAAQIMDNRRISPAFVALQRAGDEDASKKEIPELNTQDLFARCKRDAIKKQYRVTSSNDQGQTPILETLSDTIADVSSAKNAIKKMVRLYKLSNAESICRRVDGMVVKVVTGEELAYHMIYYYSIEDISEFAEKKKGEKGDGNTLVIPKCDEYKEGDEYKQKKELVNSYYNKSGWQDLLRESIDGEKENIAWGNLKNTVLINGDKATVGGAHTIVHEMMHLLANESVVEKLRERKRDGKRDGDESINEYLSRVATSLSLEEMGNASWNVDDGEEHYCHVETLYGKLIKADANFLGNADVQGLLATYLAERESREESESSKFLPKGVD